MYGKYRFAEKTVGEGETGLSARYRTWVSYSGSLGAGDKLTLDCDAKTATLLSAGVESNARPNLSGEFFSLNREGTYSIVWEDEESSRNIKITITFNPRYA